MMIVMGKVLTQRQQVSCLACGTLLYHLGECNHDYLVFFTLLWTGVSDHCPGIMLVLKPGKAY